MSEQNKKARQRALYLLGRKDYSALDLKYKLLKDYDEDICGEVVELMLEYGYIDDSKYANKLCAHLLHNKKYGKKLIMFELEKHGISPEISQQALSEFNDEDYKSEIIHFVNKKYPDISDDEKERKRAVNALIRRGHEYGHIIECLKRVECGELKVESEN